MRSQGDPSSGICSKAALGLTSVRRDPKLPALPEALKPATLSPK